MAAVPVSRSPGGITSKTDREGRKKSRRMIMAVKVKGAKKKPAFDSKYPEGKKPAVRYKPSVVYYLFLVLLVVSVFYSKAFLPGMAFVSLASAFDTYMMIKKYMTHGSSVFYDSSSEEELKFENYISSSSYRAKFRSSLPDYKWSHGFQFPLILTLTSAILVVCHVLAISPVWLSAICAWPLFMVLALTLEGVTVRIVPKPL
jgi:hypothetical protein